MHRSTRRVAGSIRVIIKDGLMKQLENEENRKGEVSVYAQSVRPLGSAV